MRSRAVLYGYKMEKGEFIPNEAEAEIVKKIYADKLSGIGVYAIGKGLYEAGTPYFSDSREKSIKKVSGILYNSKYTGEGRYPALVSREDFEKVQEMKPAAFRKPKADEISDKPVRITDFETEYHPDENVRELETKVHEELENHTLDSKAVRTMILDLAAKKYNCISQRGEPL